MIKLAEYKPLEPSMPFIGRREPEETFSTETIPTDTPATPTIPSISGNIDWSARLNDYRKTIFSDEPSQPSQPSQPSLDIKGPDEFERVKEEYLAEHPEDADDVKILSLLARRESTYNFGATNPSGATGVFQLMPFNYEGYTQQDIINNPKLQFKLAVDLLRNQRGQLDDETKQAAYTRNWNNEDLDITMWLAGSKGVRNFLLNGQNPKDRNNMTIEKYLRWVKSAKKGGSLDSDYDVIEIEDKKYYIQTARTEKEKNIGLSNRDSLPEDEGMLFVINNDEKDEDGLVWFTMKDTKFPLDIIFINEDLEVVQVSKGEPMSETPIYGPGDYVLELNADSEVKIGDDIEFISEKEVNKKMIVLDTEGNPQMTLDGGERIMSIKNTKTLIKFAKKAYVTNNDNDYKALGKRVFKFLETQNNATPEYV